MSDKTLEMTMLFDFFGDLLTDKQREYFDLYYNNDLTLSEIAEQTGISRQGVRDNLLRAETLLKEYEDKTGIVSRFNEMRNEILQIEESIKNTVSKLGCNDDEFSDVLEKLEKLKG